MEDCYIVVAALFADNAKFRANWSAEPPRTHVSGRFPPDTPLSSHGELQAEELGLHVAELEPKVDVIYTSPFYRCVQTIEPAVQRLHAMKDHLVEIRGEPGFG